MTALVQPTVSADSPRLKQLREKLAEMFQLDRADLDFGIYRIMNMKRDEVTGFLNGRLLPEVREALTRYRSADHVELERKLNDAINGARAAGIEPDDSPKVREYRQQLAGALDVAALEEDVYGHLYNFFRRYYDQGDFLSLRRYREGTYAIPYEGEEVKLHWANADQYYIKSAINLRSYAFLTGEKRRVRFELAEASIERDNVKAAKGQERRFILHAADPADEEDGELVIRFEYRPLTTAEGAPAKAEAAGDDDEDADDTAGKRKKGPSQEDLNAAIINSVLAFDAIKGWHNELRANIAKPSEDPRMLLTKHVSEFTRKWSSDYFIHKDLGGFLRRELDFYVKNEVLHLDDMDNASAAIAEQQISLIRAIRHVAHRIIDFLAALEDFQKALWLKKKFVVETSWCVTLDRIPEQLYPEIAANEDQRREWVRLFAIDKIGAGSGPAPKAKGKKSKAAVDLLDTLTPDSPSALAEQGAGAPAIPYSPTLTVEFLKANLYLPVDTALFDTAFTDCLLAELPDLDARTDGLLIHGENFQALNLIQERYRGKVKTIYIDPPYNTGGDDFLYKDNYQHSSWLTCLQDRVEASRPLMTSDGCLLTSIDRNEMHRAVFALDNIFGEDNRMAEFVWERGRKNDAKHVSLAHEYYLLYTNDIAELKSSHPEWREQKPGLEEVKSKFYQLQKQFGDDYVAIRKELQLFVGLRMDPAVARSILLFNKMDADGPYRDDTDLSWPGGGGPRYKIINPATGEPVEIPSRGWGFKEENLRKMIASGEVEFDLENPRRLLQRRHFFKTDTQVKNSVLYKHSKAATRLLRAMLGSDAFGNPKDPDLLCELLSYVGTKNDIIMDYFGGSGTTGQSVITLNRMAPESARKYVLVEMGDYFDKLLKPRVLKAAYSREWKDGVPVGRDGVSQCVKVIRLESYEDTLDNLVFERSSQAQDLLDTAPAMADGHMIQYAFRVDDGKTKGEPAGASLFSAAMFDEPFQHKLRVTRGDSAREPVADLPETFNWLLGLEVETRDRIRGVLAITGRLPDKDGTKALILWRSVSEMPNDKLNEWFAKQDYNARESEFGAIYVNGDNTLENLTLSADQASDDPGTARFKVQLIEQEFRKRMFGG
ncbi:MAG: site-specific DNA-methyltransferase [Rhodospirillaceae bacterium]|nr:site-specific DNA-methyltransferase [Rhodospirillales bacterium]